MKKWILFLMAIAAIHVCAADYTYKYMVLTASDGTQTTVPTDGLKFSISDGGLVVSSQTGTVTLPLSSLKTMRFAVDGTTTPIDEAVNPLTQHGPVDVYDLSGMYRGRYDSIGQMKCSLRTGVYVIKQNGKNMKMTVK